jgi:acetylornithine deacetylase/succinyl-diaminopimelate desuccinylase-like protein
VEKTNFTDHYRSASLFTFLEDLVRYDTQTKNRNGNFELCQRLLKSFPGFQGRFIPNENGYPYAPLFILENTLREHVDVTFVCHTDTVLKAKSVEMKEVDGKLYGSGIADKVQTDNFLPFELSFQQVKRKALWAFTESFIH